MFFYKQISNDLVRVSAEKFRINNARHNHTQLPLDLPMHMERKLQYIRNTAVRELRPGLLLQAALVTACDSNTVGVSKGTIESLQRHFPGKTIHVYGLGLAEAEVQEVQYQFFCVISKIWKYTKEFSGPSSNNILNIAP